MTNSTTGYPTAAPTIDTNTFVRVGANWYIHNQELEPDLTVQQVRNADSTAIGCIVIGCLVLLHSFYLERFKFTKARLLADCSAVGCMTSGIFILLDTGTRAANAFYLDMGVFGFSSILVQISDNVVYIFGYQCIQKNIPLVNWVLLITFIVVILFLTWFPGFTFIPCILNRNSDLFLQTLAAPLATIRYIGLVIYDIAFSYHFCVILYRVNITRKIRLPKTSQIFVIKCVVHLFSSLSALAGLLLTTTPYNTGLVSVNLPLYPLLMYNVCVGNVTL